jgi:alkylation response protein AidB-like acyl-CoA dehydrogenase
VPLTLTDEQNAFVEAIRDFAKRECGTREQRSALTGGGKTAHSPETAKKLAELGWLGMAIPEEYGGAGGSAVDMCLLLEEIGYGQIPVAHFSLSMITSGAYERFGTEEQKQEILGGIAKGNVEAIAMSEPEAGSDVGNLSCFAKRENGSYIINGQKTWISGAQEAAHILLVARTDRDGSKHEGVTMLNIPRDTPGLEIRGIETMAGPDEVNDLYFTDCEVPASALVGQEGQAWMQLMTGLNHERLVTGASFLGIARRAFDDTLSYVKERKQFDRPIGSFQTIRHRLADLATEIELCKLLVYDVAQKTDANPDVTLPREASMVKLKVTETAKKMALEGQQMMGGAGYATEYDMERYVRATLVSTIFAGTSEIQREIISKTYGL